MSPEWVQTWGPMTLLAGIELVIGLFLWYGPLVLERRTVERLRPLAVGLVFVAAIATVAGAVAGGYKVLRLLLGLPALAYIVYTWSDEYMDRLDRSRWRSFGGRKVGRWREDVERTWRERLR